MASEFTRKSILNESMYNGLYAPAAEPTPQIYSPSASFLTSKTRMADQQNAQHYEKIMQRIRAGERQPPASRTETSQSASSASGVGGNSLSPNVDLIGLYNSSSTRRAHSLSPYQQQQPAFQNHLRPNDTTSRASRVVPGVSTPNLNQAAPYSSLHSRHQEFLRKRRQDNALLNLGLSATPSPTPTAAADAWTALPAPVETHLSGDFGVAAMNPAVAPFAYTGAPAERPTYAVRNVPVRSMDEMRETIGIRREYYRDRLFGKQDAEQELELGVENGHECEYIVQEPEEEEDVQEYKGNFEPEVKGSESLAICD